MVTELEFDKPAPLVAEQVYVVPFVSVVRVIVAQPVLLEMPDSVSITLQETLTSLTYQPLLPGVPAITGVMTGAVVSTLIVIETGGAVRPAPLVAVHVSV